MTSRTGLTLRYLTRQRARTFFVVTTYIAAVAVTFLLTSAIIGNEQMFINEADALAPNWIYVEPSTPVDFPLNLSLSQAIAQDVPGLVAVAPILFVDLQVPAWQDQEVVAAGTNDSFPVIFSYPVAAGAFNLSEPTSPSAPIPLVVGQDLWQQEHLSVGQIVTGVFYGETDTGGPVAAPATLVITGLLGPKGQVSTINFDRGAYVPIGALERVTSITALTYIFASASGPGQVNASTQAITGLVTRLHQGHQDFSVTNQQQEVSFILSQIGQFESIISLVELTLLLLSAFSVFVVMTMAVKDRRREIGVLRALGAERSDILAQFLLEAGIMSVLGMALGVLAGTEVAGYLKSHASGFYGALLTSPTELGWYFGELMAALFLVGFVFSLVPAYQASRLEAVEALRTV